MKKKKDKSGGNNQHPPAGPPGHDRLKVVPKDGEGGKEAKEEGGPEMKGAPLPPGAVGVLPLSKGYRFMFVQAHLNALSAQENAAQEMLDRADDLFKEAQQLRELAGLRLKDLQRQREEFMAGEISKFTQSLGLKEGDSVQEDLPNGRILIVRK